MVNKDNNYEQGVINTQVVLITIKLKVNKPNATKKKLLKNPV